MKVLKDGETVELLNGHWYKMSFNTMYQRCCQCGLTHFWEFDVDSDGSISIRATSLNKEQAKFVADQWAKFQEEKLIEEASSHTHTFGQGGEG